MKSSITDVDGAKLYKGSRFKVTIKRATAERGYVLWIEDENGEYIPQNEPLKLFAFSKHYGFHPRWPHDPYLGEETGLQS